MVANVVKLGELCEILDSKRKPITKRDRVSGEYPYYGATGIQDYVSDYIFDEKLVLVGEDGAKWGAGENTAYAISGKSWVNNHAHVLRPNRDKILDNYLIYYLNQIDLSLYITGAIIEKLNQEQLRNIAIPLPTIQEQTRIVSLMDKANEIRQKKKLANDKLDEFLKSTFIDMFGDPVGNTNIKKDRLEKYLLYVQNGISRRRKIPQNIGELVFRIKEIRENYIDYSDINRIPLDDKEKEKYRINNNELLFIRVNGNKDYVGRNTVFQGYIEDAYFNDHIMRVKIDEQVLNSIYLSRFLNLPFGKEEIRKYIKTSAGQYTINQQGLGAVELPIPPMEKQNKFAQIVEKIEAQKQRNRQVIEQMNNLFSSLSQKAFKGEL